VPVLLVALVPVALFWLMRYVLDQQSDESDREQG
jgi:hypothetical protein